LKRIITIVITLLMALASMAPAAAAVYGDSDETAGAKPDWSPALMIKAPDIIGVSQPLTITVFTKRVQEKIAGASVYALKASDLAITADSTNYTTLVTQFEAAAESKGISFGITGNDGSVTGKLTESGRFILVAIKDAYDPGFSRISVALGPSRGLNIKAPGSIEVNKPLTLSVYERYTHHPVAGAAVYATLTDNLSITVSLNIHSSAKAGAPPGAGAALMPLVNATVIKADPANTAASVQYAAEIKSAGTLLGYTDDSGQLKYTFTDSGMYVLTATSTDYAPGLARISVRIPVLAKLLIKFPDSADAGSSITFTVTDRSSGHGVGGASLWAIKIDDINGTAESIWQGLVGGSAADEVVEKFKGWVKDKGIFLGTSADSGEVAYVFKDSGRYLLVAVKDGYTAGFNQVKVGIVRQKQITLKAPSSTATGQQITIKATYNTGQPAENVTVHAVKINDLTSIKPMPPSAGDDKLHGDQERPTAAAAKLLPHMTLSTGWVRNEADAAKDKGILIGYTDSDGQLSYTFTSPGQYVLSAVKDGYDAGFDYITCTVPMTKNSTSNTVR
jgi:hypothetical protein